MVTFVDIQKAFEHINHSVLLEEIQLIGVRVSVHKWVNGFSTGRRQFTMVNGFDSQVAKLNSGVLQGSAL